MGGGATDAVILKCLSPLNNKKKPTQARTLTGKCALISGKIMMNKDA